MSPERSLDKDEIVTALDKGEKRARGLILQNEGNREGLKDHFTIAVTSCERCLDNFSKSEFFKRENNKKTTEFLKKILLGAFTAAQCVKTLEDNLNETTISLMQKDEATDLQISLLKAVSVYQSNGESDAVSFCTQRKINEYRDGSHITAVNLPSNAPLPRSA